MHCTRRAALKGPGSAARLAVCLRPKHRRSTRLPQAAAWASQRQSRASWRGRQPRPRRARLRPGPAPEPSAPAALGPGLRAGPLFLRSSRSTASLSSFSFSTSRISVSHRRASSCKAAHVSPHHSCLCSTENAVGLLVLSNAAAHDVALLGSTASHAWTSGEGHGRMG